MKLSYIIFYVDDVTKATEFYRKAFDLKVKFIHESGTYAEMQTEGITLSFASNSMWTPNTGLELLDTPKHGVELAFTCEDLQSAMDKSMEYGAKLITSPIQKPWGQTVGYICDPFGNLIELCTPME